MYSRNYDTSHREEKKLKTETESPAGLEKESDPL